MPPESPSAASPIIHVMIVDDERWARVRLRSLLENIQGVQVVGEASTLEEARVGIAEQSVNILFLDIQFSRGLGFDFLPHVPPGTAVVYITAHPDFAVRAFEENALDYLLKPVTPERLLQTVEKYRHLASSGATANSSFILLGDRTQWQRVPTAEVSLILADGVYTRIFTQNGGNVLMLRSLKGWEQLLQEAGFIRLDRSVLVNPAAIASLRIHSRDKSEITLNGYGQTVSLGRVGTYRIRKFLPDLDTTN